MIQAEKSVFLAVGDSVILNCTVTSLLPLGPIKKHRVKSAPNTWFHRIPVSQNHKSYRYYKREKNLSFSIHISNVTPADADTYYCVKLQKLDSDKEIQSEGGTKLYVLCEYCMVLGKYSSLISPTSQNISKILRARRKKKDCKWPSCSEGDFTRTLGQGSWSSRHAICLRSAKWR